MNRRDVLKATAIVASVDIRTAAAEVVYGSIQRRWDQNAAHVRLMQKGHRIAWIDDEKVMLVGDQPTGVEDTFGIYIWDFAMKRGIRYADLNRRDYDFFFHEGYIAYRPATPQMTETHVPWMLGAVGEEKLSWISRGGSVNSPHLWPARGPGRRVVRDEAERRSHLIYMLRPEHGQLAIGSAPFDRPAWEKPDAPVRLVTPDGKTSELPILNKELFGVQDFHYAHHLGRYVVLPGYPKEWSGQGPLTGREPQVAYLISPSGDVDTRRLPSGWPVTHLEATQAGLVLASSTATPRDRGWQQAAFVLASDDARDGGGWLQSGSGELVKLFEYPVAAMGASPDGGHLAFAVNTPDRRGSVVNVVERISF